MADGQVDDVASTTIVLVDDHAVMRSGLRMLLEAEPDLQVLAEAGDIADALRYVRAYRPSVLVLDVTLREGSSLGSIPELRQASPDTAIVVLTMETNPAFARAALRGGAHGYVLKEAADADLVEAVRLAARGETYLHPRLGAKLAAAPPHGDQPPGGLTEREVEILRLIARGNTNTEIAEQLHLSVRTVESHRAHIQQKLGVTRRSALVGWAFENGLVEI